MVFSFFKKPPEKMVARPAAVPRSPKAAEPPPSPPLPLPDSEIRPLAARADDPAPRVPPSPPPPGAAQAANEISDFVFSESSPDFQIEGEIDPVDAVAEEAAILFANGQDDAVRAALEGAVAIHHTAPSERLWLMLFDLYRLAEKRAPFDALGIEYARAFEKSPPVWRDRGALSSKSADPASVSAVLLFRGDLCGENAAGFADLGQALAKNPRLRLDLSKVKALDAQGCSQLASALQQARKIGHEIELLGRDALAAQLEARIACAQREDQGCWLLFLELCQEQGRYELFEETAVNYAVTFEVSPPSWEPRLAAPARPAATATTAARPDDEAALGAYALSGNVKSSRFADLGAHAEAHDPLLIDCAQLTRIDFISAGALLNVLTTIRRSGKQIVFRHPHHLIAELFGIVGLSAVASIVAEKY